MSMVPNHHSWESKTTLMQCDEKYYPMAREIKGIPAEIELPLPAGVPFFIRFLGSDDEHRYNVVGTADMDKAFEARSKKSIYTMETRRIIPKQGRSVNNHSYPVGAIMTIMRDGKRVPYVCDENKCGGYYRLQLSGDYVCDECGIVFQWKEKEVIAPKTSYFEMLDRDDFEDDYLGNSDDTPEPEIFDAAMYINGVSEIGGTEAKEIQVMQSRSERNIKAWKESVGIKLLEDEHVPKKKAKTVRAGDVFKGKFNELTRRSRLATLLHWIRVDGVGDRDELAHVTKLHKTQVVRLLDELVEEGRITYEKQGHKMVAKYVQ
jgi:hypothetical protein